MSQYTGNLTTYASINESRQIRVYDKIAYYDPNAAPLITMLNQVKRRKPVKNTKYEWGEQDYNADWAQVTTGDVASSTSSTTVNVDDGTKFVAGDCFIVAPPVGTYAKTEVCRVVSVSTNALTVVRNVGGGHLMTISSGQDLRIIGNMFEEYSGVASQKRSIPSSKLGYLQISKTSTAFSNTAIAVATEGVEGSERDKAHIQDMIEHKRKLNSTLIFGRTSESTTGGPTGNPIRSSPGILDVVTTNVLDSGGILTWKKLCEFSEMCFRYPDGKDKILVTSPKIHEAITNWGFSKLLLKPVDTKIGLKITEVISPHGTWMMVKDWMLRNGDSGSYGYGGLALSLDFDEITYLYLSNNGVNRDTTVTRDVIQSGADGKTDQILTEYGFRIRLEKNHGILTNVSDYML